MSVIMLSVLLGLCVVLVSGAPDEQMKDFDFNKFSGLWYEIAFALPVEIQNLPPKPRRLGAVKVEMQDRHLIVTSAYDSTEDCVKQTDVAEMDRSSGKFRIARENGDKEVQVLSTNYKTYAIMDVRMQMGEMTQHVLKLYSRILEQSAEAMTMFNQVVVSQGLPTSNVHLLLWDMTCVELLTGASAPRY